MDPDLEAIAEPLRQSVGGRAAWAYYEKTDYESRWAILDVKDAYCLDQISLDEAVAQIDEIMVDYAEKFIEANEVDCVELGFESLES